jgi:RNA polymerase sigma-70 factor (ECF subfamily)
LKESVLQVVDWQVVVKKHGPIVWKTAYRLLGNHTDAADCFQETFVCALEFSRRQYVFNFSALLARLATARAIDRLRRRMREPNVGTETADYIDVPSDNIEPYQHVQAKELAEGLREALTQLPQQEAQVFCLRYLNNMSYRQIAGQLGIKNSTTGVLLHRARTKLREHLEKAAVT